MAIQNTPRTSQLRQRTDLQNLGQTANKFVSEIISSVDTEVNSPLKLSATFPTANARLNFQSSEISSADGSKKAVSPVKKQIFNSLSSPWINFQDQTVSNAADFDIVFPASTVGYFRHVGFTLIGSGKIKALFSAEAATEGTLSNAGALFVSGGLPLGYITVECTNAVGYFKTAGSATNIIENAKIFRFGSGAGGGSGASSNGTGAEVIDLRFRAELQDNFAEIPSDETPVDVNTNKTDPSLHDVANELYRLNYDASKTVTGTGTAMSLSAAPAFTVKVGDVLVVGDEVREITALGNINTTGGGFTIASAFTVNPSSAVSCVSQAVYTQDLNGFDGDGTGLAISSQITDDVSTVMVNYEDSLTLGDVTPDWGSAPHVAYQVTADNVAWSDRKVRTTNLNGELEAVATPTADAEFRIRFFANKTSGSGGVNLLSFKAFWHEQIGETAGENYYTAFARPTDAIYQNVSHSVVGGKSRFAFNFSYGRGAFGGEAAGSALDVYVNGQLIPRYEAGIVDLTQAYYKEISDNIIEMDVDYSTSGLEFIFKSPRLIIDSRESNSSRITNLEEVVTGLDSSNVVNYITNSGFEVNADGWEGYADAAGVAPVDGTGGAITPSTFDRTTTTPLRGNGSGLFSKATATQQGKGVSANFTIDTADQGKMLEIKFDYTTSVNYVDGAMRVYIYDVTNAVLIEPSQRDIMANSGQASYLGYFQAASNSTSYRLIFHVSSTLSASYEFKFDAVRVGPIQSGNAGTFVSDWESYTPVTSWTTNTTVTGQWRRVGSNIEIKLRALTSGAPNATSLEFNLPSGLSWDTTKMLASNNIGYAAGVDGGAFHLGTPYRQGTQSIRVAGDDSAQDWNNTVPFTWGAGDAADIFATGPIQGWSIGVSASEIPSNSNVAFRAQLSGAQTINSTALTKVAFASVTATDCYDTSGAFDTANNRFVATETGIYIFQWGLRIDSFTSNEPISMQLQKNGTAFHISSFIAGPVSNYRSIPFCSAPVQLNKGDYVELWIASTLDASYLVSATQGSTFFSGFKINTPAIIAPTEFVGCRYNTNSGQAVADATTIIFEDKIYDSHNAYNPTNGSYVVPISGYYLFQANITTNSIAAGTVGQYLAINVRNNTQALNTHGQLSFASTTTARQHSASVAVVLYCNKGDNMLVRFFESLPAVNLSTDSTVNWLDITKVS